MKNLTAIALIILCLAAVQPALAQNPNGTINTTASTTKSALTESDKIGQLITEVRNMEGATFIRNGSEHSCQEAADHLQAKWEKHGSKIKTADDFIVHLATKSSMSGEMYKIRFTDGREVNTADILRERLLQLK